MIWFKYILFKLWLSVQAQWNVFNEPYRPNLDDWPIEFPTAPPSSPDLDLKGFEFEEEWDRLDDPMDYVQ